MKRLSSLMLAVCLLLTLAVSEVTLPAAPDAYYLDGAGVLTENTKNVINLNSANLCDACGAQIVIVTLTDTGDYGSGEYAAMLMNEWGVGDKDRNNGVLFLLALRGGDDNGYFLCTGTGTEAIISNADADQLLTDYFDEYYARGDYDGGVKSLFEAVFCRMRDFYGLDLAYLDDEAVETLLEQTQQAAL